MTTKQFERRLNQDLKSLDKNIIKYSKSIDTSIENLLLKAERIKNKKESNIIKYKKELVNRINENKKDLEIRKYLEAQGYKNAYSGGENIYFIDYFPENSKFEVKLNINDDLIVEQASINFLYKGKKYTLYFFVPDKNAAFNFNFSYSSDDFKISCNTLFYNKLKKLGFSDLLKKKLLSTIKLYEDDDVKIILSKNIPLEISSMIKIYQNFR